VTTLKLPLEVEPAGRALTGAPLRWRLHPMFVLSGFIPLDFYRELEGVAWDCPDCGTAGALALRFKRFDGYTFRCRSCRRKTEFNGIRADQLAVALGVPLGRRRAPEIKVWLDEDGNLRESVNGVVKVVDVSAKRAALARERQERESAPPEVP
jgi:hypothetical protein